MNQPTPPTQQRNIYNISLTNSEFIDLESVIKRATSITYDTAERLLVALNHARIALLEQPPVFNQQEVDELLQNWDNA